MSQWVAEQNVSRQGMTTTSQRLNLSEPVRSGGKPQVVTHAIPGGKKPGREKVIHSLHCQEDQDLQMLQSYLWKGASPPPGGVKQRI